MNGRANTINVAVMGGEGIGPEVTAQGHRVLQWFADRRALPVTFTEAEYGKVPYLREGEVMPPATKAAIDAADAILFGATGGPETVEVPAEARRKDSLLAIRQRY